MVDVLRTIVAIALVFGLVIFIHELGHFLAAKALGVYAPRFSIGFGRALWSRKWGETEYVLAALPLGGYVRMASREDETMARIEGGGEHPAEAPGAGGASEGERPRWYDPEALAPFGPKPVPAHRWFESKPLPARLLILCAGVIMNMLLGFVVLAVLSWNVGDVVIHTREVGMVRPLPRAPALAAGLAAGDTIEAVNGRAVRTWNDVADRIDSAPPGLLELRTQRGVVAVPLGGSSGVTREQLLGAVQPFYAPVIDEVVPDSPADRGGLEAGDSVVSVGGSPVRSWAEIVARIEHSPGVSLSFGVVRHGAPATLTLRPDSVNRRDDATGRMTVVGQIGALVRLNSTREAISGAQAVQRGWSQTWFMAGSVVQAVRDLATGALSFKRLNGPIAIGRAAGTAVQRGWADVFYLLALLSVNVAVFNLLPIPILDGGQIVLNVVESATGSAISLKTREALFRFGLAAIALLFVVVMYNDITSLVRSLFGL